MTKPTVFISYSKADIAMKTLVVTHLKALVRQGDIVLWDDSKIDTGEDWYPAIQAALQRASVAVCLISDNFLATDFIIKEEIPAFLEKREKEGLLLVPILIGPCAWKVIRWLKRIQLYPPKALSLEEMTSDVERKKALAAITEMIYDKVTDPDFKPVQPKAIIATAPQKIDITHLPVTGATLFGRDKELTILDEAWASTQTNIVSFIAWGGVGKSTLVNKWLQYMEEANYKGAVKVFAWSFYSQGTSEQVSSADAFIATALEFFGDKDPTKGSAWGKGQRLAELIQQQPTLLILDGMEPLQSGHEFERGRIKDPGLTMLMRSLALKNNGLCVVTSRETIADIAQYKNKTLQVDLDTLSTDAGRALLRVGGVQGSDEALENAVTEFGCHALAINLLPTYLRNVTGHPIAAAMNIADLAIDVNKGKHPRRVIAVIAQRFVDKPEGDLLKLLGFFDRPADMAAIEQMIAPPVIVGLTEQLCDKGEGVLFKAINTLRAENLLADASTHRPDTLDCHPLIREHFGDNLQSDSLDGFKAGHGRLYEYYKKLPEKELPDTLEEMEPLFAAVKHGCLSGQHQAALDDVYWERVCKKGEDYSVSKLGLLGANLSCLAGFFEQLWDKPAANLTDDAKAVSLSWTGFRLRAVGRLEEAAQPMNAGLDMRIEQENWKDAAVIAGNLSELYLTLGELALAIQYGVQSVTLADRSEDGFEMEARRAGYADALYQNGQSQEAEHRFIEAEAMQQKRQSYHPYLYSLPGFLHCGLLLSMGQYQEGINRAQSTIKIAESNKWLLMIALDKLTIGKALMLQAVKNLTAYFVDAATYLNQSVEGLRESGSQHHLPRGLITRATLYHHQKVWLKSWTDLEETREIAQYGKMRLHLTDYHLTACRCIKAQLAEGGELFDIIENGETLSLNKTQMDERFKAHLKQADDLVKATGYFRRTPEVEALQKD